MRWALHLPLGLWLWKHQCDEGSAHHRVLEWPGARHKVDSMHGTLMYVTFSHADVSWNCPTRSAGDMPFREDAGTCKSSKSFHESFIDTAFEKKYKHIICVIECNRFNRCDYPKYVYSKQYWQYAHYFVALCAVILQLCDTTLHHSLGCVKVYMFWFAYTFSCWPVLHHQSIRHVMQYDCNM